MVSMKWKQLFKDLNLFLFYQPNISLRTAKQIISILQTNTSYRNQIKYDIQFRQLQQTKSKQISITAKSFNINKLRKDIKRNISLGDKLD